MKNCFKLICIFTIILGFSNSVFALSAKERAINALLFERKFDEAFELVNKIKSSQPSINQYKGYLLGSGVLSSGKDLCGAIKYLEKAYISWKSIRSDLDFLYGGDWAGIAAMEGNRQALFDMGVRISKKRNSPYFFATDELISIKKSQIYFFNAAQLGLVAAEEYLFRHNKQYLDVDFSKYRVKMKFKKILCPIRMNQKKGGSTWQDFMVVFD